MKSIKFIPFLFLFSIIFVNLIPINGISVNNQLNLNSSSINSINALMNLLNTSTLNQFLFGICYIIALSIFIIYAKRVGASKRNLVIFTIGFVITILINSSFLDSTLTNIISSITNVSYSSNSNDSLSSLTDFLKNLVYFIAILKLASVILTGVMFIIIVNEIHYALDAYILEIIATIILLVFTIITVYHTVFITPSNDDSVSYIKTTLTLSFGSFLALILFKIGIVIETIGYILHGQKDDEKDDTSFGSELPPEMSKLRE